MAEFPDVAKRQLGFFHGLSKVPTESTQQVYESKYKSAHSIRFNDIWTDNISYSIDSTSADAEESANSAIVKYTLHNLTEISGSNGQSWYLDNAGVFVRPFISPVDIPHSVTNEPSYGYQGLLYRSDNTIITPTEGSWIFDYYAGLVKFSLGYTPSDMSWGIPKITCYTYSGSTGVGGNTEEVEEHILSSLDITNKYIDLINVPVAERKVFIFVNGGLKGFLNIDYHITTNRISWNGDNYDGILSVNDILTILYWF